MYVELRTHSAFSFLRAASLPEDLIERAAALGYPAIGLGDLNGVYGAPRFHQAAVRAGVRAIVGCEVRLESGPLPVRGSSRATNNLTTNNLPPSAPGPQSSVLHLLVATRTGYRNLCKLLTQIALRAPKGEAVATLADLEGHTEGLICLAGANSLLGAGGYVVQLFVVGEENRSGERNLTTSNLTTNNLLSLFPNRLYLDLQRHFDPAEERLNRRLLDIARARGVPIVATNGVRHADPQGRALFDVLTCIREGTSLDAAGRLLARNAERHLKSPREMAALFRDLPEAIANSERIAEQCEFTLADLGYRFPEFPLPPGETADGHLRELTYAGARGRYGKITARVRRQLEHELKIIAKLELAGYFLIVWDIVRECRARGILAQGRGSAANSAVCYSLGITAVDAVGMELLFERFLSEERGEWPDIDIDLPSGDRREEIIQYVYRRYGPRGAAMTANVISYRTRSAVREVGKALGFALEQVDKLSKLLNRFEFRDDLDELAKQLRAGGVDPSAPRVRLLVDLVQRIQTLPRHLGQHSGGMVIAAGRLDEVVPLEPASMPGRVVVQWDKDDCADLGIIKVDLLGLGMMAVLQDAVPLIRDSEGVEVDYAKLPPDDPAVYDMLRRADTIGVFQVESRAQMATLPRLRPEKFYDLVVEVAIIRPGPIVGQMVHPYLNRRAGREPVTYPHPSLEPILKRTLGVPLFQEQLLRIAMTAAGFSGGEAEELRRAMGFKRSAERMKTIEARLRAGMARNRISGKTADDIVRGITSFALYGFPESHAASFALIAYASAYLKAHHPEAFYCALLNNFPMGFYHPATLVKDAQRHGVRVLPVDVTRSGWLCAVEKQVVGLLGCYVVREDVSSSSGLTTNNLTTNNLLLRLGLKYVAGLREEAGKRIETERSKYPFASIEDVAYRCDLRDDELATLAEIGAFAAFGVQRRDALWQLAGLPRGALFERVSSRNRTTNNPTTNNLPRRDHDQGPVVPRAAGVAASDGAGEGVLSAHSTLAEGGTVRVEQSNPSRRSFDSGEHRRGQRPRDETRFHSVPKNRTGQPPRVGNVPSSHPGPESDPTGRYGPNLGANGVHRSSPQPADPISPANNLTTNNLTTNNLATNNLSSPLADMTPLDRTLADYRGTGVTVGPHVMAHLREELTKSGVLSARELRKVRNGRWVKIAGLVIVRQRPGTAKGFCFLTLEDETGTSNAVVVPDLFQQHRTVIHTAALLQVEGPVQVVDDVIHVRARRFVPLALPQQSIQQSGHGYRMRPSPDDDEPPPMPKSHDFR